jgi:hypothetical protein
MDFEVDMPGVRRVELSGFESDGMDRQDWTAVFVLGSSCVSEETDCNRVKLWLEAYWWRRAET